MKIITRKLLIGAIFMFLASPAIADDMEGRVESVDQSSQSLVVQGITFYTTESTDYDDGLNGFANLSPGQKVEIDFQYRDGKHYATEVEVDD